ncbi:MAG: GNAT family N-acetyltransferase [Euryarchaeota archaeon]|nr:GNAT family N-acetyltransferase [Euryarchaeota archaeon]
MLEPQEKTIISEANWDNYEAIINVLRAVDAEFVPRLTEGENLRVKVTRILNDQRRDWIKAVVDNRIVGVVAVIYNYRRPRLGLIETLAVLPQYRRLGIGRQLVQYAMAKLFNCDMDAVLITTWETNGTAIRMYEELGFKKIMRKKVEGSYFKLFFLFNFDTSERSPTGFSRLWSYLR